MQAGHSVLCRKFCPRGFDKVLEERCGDDLNAAVEAKWLRCLKWASEQQVGPRHRVDLLLTLF